VLSFSFVGDVSYRDNGHRLTASKYSFTRHAVGSYPGLSRWSTRPKMSVGNMLKSQWVTCKTAPPQTWSHFSCLFHW